MKDLRNKVVLITGASSGIGRATAIAFAKEGARVAMAARSGEKLAENSRNIAGSIAIKTDVSDEKQVKEMVDGTARVFGKIDVLINNAAMVAMSRSDSLDPSVMRKAFETNLIGAVNATNYALKYMRKQGGGHVINIGSPGFLIGLPFLTPYAASKAAMFAWTRGLQAEWNGTEIFVTEYLPGYIETESSVQSEFGQLPRDVFDDPDQNFILRFLAKPRSAGKVASDLVRCARNPKPVMYSGFGIRLGMFLSSMWCFRRSTGAKMTRTFCKRMGIDVFKDKQI